MIDFHSHILPGMDDGSKDVEMSLQMLEMMRHQGVQTVAATPHFYADQDTPEDFVQRRQEAFCKLQGVETPQVILGAEVAYFDGMSRSDGVEKLQLGNSGLILVEMPFGAWSQRMVNELCQLPLQTGLTPVLAHVERYRSGDQFPKYRRQLIEGGVAFQVNAGSFLHWRTRGWVLRLLRNGQVHFLGSDAHNVTTRAPRLQEAVAVITRKLGSDAVDGLNDLAKQLLNR